MWKKSNNSDNFPHPQWPYQGRLLLTSVCRNLCNEEPSAVPWGPVLYLLPGEERFPMESMDFFSCLWSWGSWLSRIFMCFSWSRRKYKGSWSLPPPKHIASFLLSPHWPPDEKCSAWIMALGQHPHLSFVQGSLKGLSTSPPEVCSGT